MKQIILVLVLVLVIIVGCSGKTDSIKPNKITLTATQSKNL